MPLYEYADGSIRQLSVANRDQYPGRVMPSRINVCPRGAPTQEDELMQGWKEIEEQDGRGARDLERSLGLTSSQVKDAMLAPTRPEPVEVEG
jgi:hypothetical protein